MESGVLKDFSNTKRSQIIDANLDRAREGIRVIEDWCRFYLDNDERIKTLKDWRQRLGLLHHQNYKLARCTSSDQGIGLTHDAQKERKSCGELISANCSRVQEALRVLEEFSRNSDPELAQTSAEIRYSLYELEITILKHSIHSTRTEKLKSCNLCLITSDQEGLIDTVLKSLTAGVKMIQYRSKGKDDYTKFSEAKKISELCKRFQSLLIINDRIDIALAINADGVHLGQNDLPSSVARELIGDQMIIGRSTHSRKEVELAALEGCDYIAFGPIYRSDSKPNLKTVDTSLLSEISNITDLPWFAIGGINIENIHKAKSLGVEKVAVINAIMNAKDAGKASNQLIKSLL